MTAVKTRNAWGFAAKIESTYGSINATTTADGILTTDVPDVSHPQFVNDGSRGNTPGGAPRPDVNRSGRFGSARVGAEGIGAGAAYSAGVKPHLDVLMRICGMEATGSFGGGTESWKYAPETGPTGLESATVDSYVAGQLYRLYGAYGSFEVSADGPGVPQWDFELLGIADPVVDAAIPAFVSYPAISNNPPKAENITLNVGLFTAAKCRSFHFVQGRKHDAARADINAAAPSHAGFTPGERMATLEVVVERVALATTTPWATSSTLNPYKMAEDKNLVTCSLIVGSVQYKRWKLWSGPVGGSTLSAQLLEVQDTNDGATETWTLKFGFKPSTYAASDEFTFSYD